MKPVATTAADFEQHETGYVTAHIALAYKTELYTADQLREAHVRALKTAYRHVLCLPAKARVSDVLDELRRMADELEKADAIRGLA